MRNVIYSAGFSLLEVVLAITIIVIALVPMIQNISGNSQIKIDVKTMTENYYCAQELLEKGFESDFDDLIVGDSSGDREINGTHYSWERIVALYDGDNDGNADSDLKHIYLKVGDIEVVTLRYNIQ
ncbi:MAG: type IV pilus modification PilV family protein [bacterium]